MQDTGIGMSPDKLDALFRELEQVQSETDEGLQEKLAPQTKRIGADSDSKRTLGLGLALVARIIRNMNGQLRLKSEEGKGSRFVILLSFLLPTDGSDPERIAASDSPGLLPPTDQPITPPTEIGEVMLVDKSAQKSQSASRMSLAHRNSTDSVASLKSVKSMGSFNSFRTASSARSDVDRMIDAIQEPVLPAKPHAEPENFHTQLSTRIARPLSSSSSKSINALQYASPPTPTNQKISGQTIVKDSKTPIRPVRIPSEATCGSSASEAPLKPPPRILFDVPKKTNEKAQEVSSDCLDVLVAEDDPINSKIIRKRLEKLGHVVHTTVNGEECSSAFGANPEGFDVVLMDMQVSDLSCPSKQRLQAFRCLSLTA